MSLCGTLKRHCCGVENGDCPYLVKSEVPGFIWACSLKNKYGTWEAVHSSEEYITNVKPVWIKHGVADCGDWPPVGVICKLCGKNK